MPWQPLLIDIELEFEDGSRGDYILFQRNTDKRLFWSGEGSDKDGNTINDPVPENPALTREFTYEAIDGTPVATISYNPFGAEAGYAYAASEYVTVKQICTESPNGGYLCEIVPL